MAKYTIPKLVMGYIEVVAPDGEPGIPYDEAVIHLEGDEDSEIEVRCPGALRLAPFIVNATNNHAALIEMLRETILQLEYMQERLSTSTGVAVLTRANQLLADVGSVGEKS